MDKPKMRESKRVVRLLSTPKVFRQIPGFEKAVGLRAVPLRGLDPDIVLIDPQGPTMGVIEGVLGTKARCSEVGQLLGYWAHMELVNQCELMGSLDRAAQRSRNGGLRDVDAWLRLQGGSISTRAELETLVGEPCGRPDRMRLFLAMDQVTKTFQHRVVPLIRRLVPVYRVA